MLDRMKSAFTEWRGSVIANTTATKAAMRSVLITGTSSLGNLTGQLISGKKSFEEWSKGVVAAIAKVLLKLAVLRIFGAGTFGAAFGIGVIGGAFARGGRPRVGRAALVGEKGPELFIPDTAGTVVPTSVFAGAGAGSGLTIINDMNFNITGMDFGSRQAAQRLIRGINEEVKRSTVLGIELARRVQDSGDENSGRAF